MPTFFLSIGSNIEPGKNVPACLDLLKEKFRVNRVSSIYESDPVGPAGNRKFWNCAAEIQTELGADDLQVELRTIEARLGRRRSSDKFAPRTIDIDILPQENYQRMAFIIVPLAEIAPTVRDPETGKSWRELSLQIKNSDKILKKVNPNDQIPMNP